MGGEEGKKIGEGWPAPRESWLGQQVSRWPEMARVTTAGGGQRLVQTRSTQEKGICTTPGFVCLDCWRGRDVINQNGHY